MSLWAKGGRRGCMPRGRNSPWLKRRLGLIAKVVTGMDAQEECRWLLTHIFHHTGSDDLCDWVEANVEDARAVLARIYSEEIPLASFLEPVFAHKAINIFHGRFRPPLIYRHYINDGDTFHHITRIYKDAIGPRSGPKW